MFGGALMGGRGPDAQHLRVSPLAARAVEGMVFLSGSARSGTTILGKILHTAREVEYAMEPPTLFSLIPLVDQLDAATWKMLYETFCYEELLLGFLAGRTLNFNPHDDSCIYNAKPRAEILQRHERSFRKGELEALASRRVLVVKMPDMVPFLPRMRSYYPAMKIVVVNRKANDVLNSLHKKAWFEDLSADSPDLVWPYRLHKGCKVLFWVEPEQADWWCAATPLERCAYYCLRMMQVLPRVSGCITVNYHHLLERPAEVTNRLFGSLGLSPTTKTEEALATVAPTTPPREDLLAKLPPSLRKSIEAVEAKHLA
jgi:hypothetical protein